LRPLHEHEGGCSHTPRKRGWAFLAMGIFWLILIIGVVQNAIAEAG
jgi:hypothetical protein